MKAIKTLLGIDQSLAKLKSQDMPILIYGLNDLTKGLLMHLVHEGVDVDGFLVEDAHMGQEICYLNKKVVSFQEVYHSTQDYRILDLFGHHSENLRSRIPHEVLDYAQCQEKQTIIYGAGYQGKKAYDCLHDFGISVHCFCDKDPAKQHLPYCEKNVISVETLAKDYRGVPVVVALDAAIARNVAQDLLHNNIITDAYLYAGESMQTIFSPNLLLSSDIRAGKAGIYPFVLYRQIVQAKHEHKKIILYGHREDMEEFSTLVPFLGLHIAYGIDCEGDSETPGNIPYRAPFDLLYEDRSKIAVWVFSRAGDQARQLVRELGIDPRMLFYDMESSGSIGYQWLLDPNLGTNIQCNHEKSFMVRRTRNTHGASTRMGIVGGSTSDITTNELSWPEQLISIADKNEKNLQIYAGGTGGYNIAQELVKFIRDMSHLNLDILISYSRMNEFAPNPNNFFLNGTQEKFFRILEQMQKKHFGHEASSLYFGHSMTNVAEYWFHQERMLYAICRELGIKFYAICQPYLFEKNPLTSDDQEIIEHITWLNMQEAKKNLWDIRALVKKKKRDFPWLIDFTELFDGRNESIYLDICHLTSHGNYLLAERIYQLIAEDLRQ